MSPVWVPFLARKEDCSLLLSSPAALRLHPRPPDLCLPPAHPPPAGQAPSDPAVDRSAFSLEYYQEFLRPSLPECMFPIMLNSSGEVHVFLSWLNQTAVSGKRPDRCRSGSQERGRGLSGRRPASDSLQANRRAHAAGFFLGAQFSPVCRIGVSATENEVSAASLGLGLEAGGWMWPHPQHTQVSFSETTWSDSGQVGQGGQTLMSVK